MLTSAPVPVTFITFEGLDGSGKSTHLRRVKAWLEEHGLAVVETREPGGTALGSEIRKLFLDHRSEIADGIVELLMVFASRRQHLVEVIDPALAAGHIVLCDRFTDSTLAYQGYGRGVSRAEIALVDHVATGGRRPDRTLLFDLPAETARERGHSPRRRQAGEIDRLDAEELDFYQRVRDGYLTLAGNEPGRFRVIDSSGPTEATAPQVLAALADLVEPP
ncbi:MAG TPA: dTMP kinase [Thermoanaerobaculia bacterium]|nr:dTMP kinase [Thermoanaerobaculia bacterium]